MIWILVRWHPELSATKEHEIYLWQSRVNITLHSQTRCSASNITVFSSMKAKMEIQTCIWWVPDHCTGTSKGGLLTASHTLQFLLSERWYPGNPHNSATEEIVPILEVLVSIISSIHSDYVIIMASGFQCAICRIHQPWHCSRHNKYIILNTSTTKKKASSMTQADRRGMLK
jgi:hypothetical protein